MDYLDAAQKAREIVDALPLEDISDEYIVGDIFGLALHKDADKRAVFLGHIIKACEHFGRYEAKINPVRYPQYNMYIALKYAGEQNYRALGDAAISWLANICYSK